jgi:hypothetical protein
MKLQTCKFHSHKNFQKNGLDPQNKYISALVVGREGHGESNKAVGYGKIGFQRAADTSDLPVATLFRRLKKLGDDAVVIWN